jgi:hypothetical protein
VVPLLFFLLVRKTGFKSLPYHLVEYMLTP